MKVKVYAASFCSFKDIDKDGYMTLADNAILNDVCKNLRIPFPLRKLMLPSVNHRIRPLKTRLKEGDVVSFFPDWGWVLDIVTL